MTPAERVATLRRGVAALRWVEAQRRRTLPPPEREDAALLREVRGAASLAERLEIALDIDGFDRVSVYAREATLSMEVSEDDAALVASYAADTGAGTPYRRGAPPPPEGAALQALAALLARFADGEFMPPPSYFDISAPEA